MQGSGKGRQGGVRQVEEGMERYGQARQVKDIHSQLKGLSVHLFFLKVCYYLLLILCYYYLITFYSTS